MPVGPDSPARPDQPSTMATKLLAALMAALAIAAGGLGTASGRIGQTKWPLDPHLNKPLWACPSCRRAETSQLDASWRPAAGRNPTVRAADGKCAAAAASCSRGGVAPSSHKNRAESRCPCNCNDAGGMLGEHRLLAGPVAWHSAASDCQLTTAPAWPAPLCCAICLQHDDSIPSSSYAMLKSLTAGKRTASGCPLVGTLFVCTQCYSRNGEPVVGAGERAAQQEDSRQLEVGPGALATKP